MILAQNDHLFSSCFFYKNLSFIVVLINFLSENLLLLYNQSIFAQVELFLQVLHLFFQTFYLYIHNYFSSISSIGFYLVLFLIEFYLVLFLIKFYLRSSSFRSFVYFFRLLFYLFYLISLSCYQFYYINFYYYYQNFQYFTFLVLLTYIYVEVLIRCLNHKKE